MPVDTIHAEFTARAPQWQAIIHCLAGGRSVKAAGELHLPKIYGSDPGEYEAYKTRAVWFNATARTHEAWVGMLTRKEAELVSPDSLAAFIEDCDMQGGEWRAYIETVLRELCATSRAGTLIDWSEAESRPYLTHYAAADITNWSVQRIAGKQVLTRVVLRETSTVPFAGDNPADEFDSSAFEQWRVLAFDGIQATWQTWRRNKDKGNGDASDFLLAGSGVFARRVNALPGIPFVFHGVGQDRICPASPMLGDIADLNLSHYRTSADLENGLHLCGIPTPWAAGFTDEDTKELLLGATKVWITDDPNARCGFLEYTGSGLTGLVAAMADKERQMAILGARVAQPEAKGETATAAKMRATAETSSLSTIGQSASRSLSEVLNWAAWWMGTKAKPSDEADAAYCVVNRELVSGSADPAEITALVQAFLQGAMSFDALFYNFKKANLYPDEHELEAEQTLIKEQAPAPPAAIPPAAA